MIIYLFVTNADSIKSVESKEFRILNIYYKNGAGQNLFTIDTTEEELVFLKLKYGNKNAWKR